MMKLMSCSIKIQMMEFLFSLFSRLLTQFAYILVYVSLSLCRAREIERERKELLGG